MPGKRRVFTTRVEPVSPPYAPKPRDRWWRRRALPPGPQRLFHAPFITIVSKLTGHDLGVPRCGYKPYSRGLGSADDGTFRPIGPSLRVTAFIAKHPLPVGVRQLLPGTVCATNVAPGIRHDGPVLDQPSDRSRSFQSGDCSTRRVGGDQTACRCLTNPSTLA